MLAGRKMLQASSDMNPVTGTSGSYSTFSVEYPLFRIKVRHGGTRQGYWFRMEDQYR